MFVDLFVYGFAGMSHCSLSLEEISEKYQKQKQKNKKNKKKKTFSLVTRSIIVLFLEKVNQQIFYFRKTVRTDAWVLQTQTSRKALSSLFSFFFFFSPVKKKKQTPRGKKEGERVWGIEDLR